MAKYSIRCNMLPTAQKDGRHTLRIRVSWEGQRLSHCLSTPIPPSEWDERSGMPKRSQQKAVKEINEVTTAVDRLFDKCHLEQRTPSMEEMRLALGEKAASVAKAVKSTHNIVEAIDEFIRDNQRSGNWSDGTSSRWGVMKSHLREWNGSMDVENVDEEAVRSYIDYLYEQELHNTTVAKNLSWLKTFLRWCRRKGYTTNSQWEDYKPRFKGNGDEKEIVYLTQEELLDIMALDLTASPHLDRVRDVLLFCCFSGLRYSDAAKLRRSDIQGDHFRVVTKKTSDALNIELNDMTKAILEKYSGDDGDALALPIISNQKMNNYLKELAKMAKIDTPVRRVYWVKADRHEEVVPKHDLISTHCGRRTFVVSALTLEIPAEVIMRWTGHSSHEAMKPYIAIVDKQKRESMAKFDSLLGQQKAVKNDDRNLTENLRKDV